MANTLVQYAAPSRDTKENIIVWVLTDKRKDGTKWNIKDTVEDAYPREFWATEPLFTWTPQREQFFPARKICALPFATIFRRNGAVCTFIAMLCEGAFQNGHHKRTEEGAAHKFSGRWWWLGRKKVHVTIHAPERNFNKLKKWQPARKNGFQKMSCDRVTSPKAWNVSHVPGSRYLHVKIISAFSERTM